MKRILTISTILLLLLVASCDIAGTEEIKERDDRSHYLSESQYETLLDALEGRAIVTRTSIDNELVKLNVRTDYRYTYYQSGSYVAHTLNWRMWHNGSWIYYRDVTIWTLDGKLHRSMCSYYRG
jgi:hypothetical protein